MRFFRFFLVLLAAVIVIGGVAGLVGKRSVGSSGGGGGGGSAVTSSDSSSNQEDDNRILLWVETGSIAGLSPSVFDKSVPVLPVDTIYYQFDGTEREFDVYLVTPGSSSVDLSSSIEEKKGDFRAGDSWCFYFAFDDETSSRSYVRHVETVSIPENVVQVVLYQVPFV